MAPKRATGTPATLPNRLEYTWLQLMVALTSQKLRYPGLASSW